MTWKMPPLNPKKTFIQQLLDELKLPPPLKKLDKKKGTPKP